MKDGKNSRCKECAREAARKWAVENPERKKQADKAYYRNNFEKISAANKAYAEKHAEHLKAKNKEWVERNRQRVNANALRWVERNYEQSKASCRRYRQNNKAKVNAKTARRNKRSKHATPVWLTPAHHREILGMYERAVSASRTTGIPHEVDHIVPLQGKTVCGLHVPWNLSVCPAHENRSKGNKFDEWGALYADQAKLEQTYVRAN